MPRDGDLYAIEHSRAKAGHWILHVRHRTETATRAAEYLCKPADPINSRVKKFCRCSSVGADRGRYRNKAPEPLPEANNDFRRRTNERAYEAEVRSVHAVVGPPDQRCWVERGQIDQGRGERNVAGGVAGAVIGGILGHQFGYGRGSKSRPPVALQCQFIATGV
jgi:hypothetical protein